MPFGKNLIKKLEQQLISLSPYKTDDLIDILQNLNNELQLALKVIIRKEEKIINNLDTTFKHFYEDSLSEIIAKFIYDFFNKPNGNDFTVSKNEQSSLYKHICSQIEQKYKKHVIKSLGDVSKLYDDSNYLYKKLGSPEIEKSIDNTRNIISDQAYFLLQKGQSTKHISENVTSVNDLSKSAQKVQSLAKVLEEVLSSANTLRKAANDIAINVLEHHSKNISFNKKLQSRAKLFYDITNYILKQKKDTKNLLLFYNSCSKFYINKQLYKSSGNSSDLNLLHSLSKETMDFLKIISNYQLYLFDNAKEYDKIFGPIRNEVKNFLIEINSHSDKPFHSKLKPLDSQLFF